jgi:hypothetical protein
MTVDRRCCIAQGFARRNPAAITGAIVTDRLALDDYALKAAHVATGPGMSAVLQDAAHSAR